MVCTVHMNIFEKSGVWYTDAPTLSEDVVNRSDLLNASNTVGAGTPTAHMLTDEGQRSYECDSVKNSLLEKEITRDTSR